jgi:hypothetical protein
MAEVSAEAWLKKLPHQAGQRLALRGQRVMHALRGKAGTGIDLNRTAADHRRFPVVSLGRLAFGARAAQRRDRMSDPRRRIPWIGIRHPHDLFSDTVRLKLERIVGCSDPKRRRCSGRPLACGHRIVRRRATGVMIAAGCPLFFQKLQRRLIPDRSLQQERLLYPTVSVCLRAQALSCRPFAKSATAFVCVLATLGANIAAS